MVPMFTDVCVCIHIYTYWPLPPSLPRPPIQEQQARVHNCGGDGAIYSDRVGLRNIQYRSNSKIVLYTTQQYYAIQNDQLIDFVFIMPQPKSFIGRLPPGRPSESSAHSTPSYDWKSYWTPQRRNSLRLFNYSFPVVVGCSWILYHRYYNEEMNQRYNHAQQYLPKLDIKLSDTNSLEHTQK